MADIFFLKLLDKILGRIVCAIIPSPQFYTLDSLHNLILIRPGGIGDAVLLSSTINSLKANYPDIRITILAEQRNAGVLSLIPGVDHVLRYDIPREFIQALSGKYDVVIDSEQWYRLSAVVAWMVRAPVKIGFNTNERRRMFTHCVQYDPIAYELDNFQALLKPLGVDYQDARAFTLTVPTQATSTANQLLHGLESFVAVFPGASTTEKRWGADKFRQVVETLSVLGIKIVVVGGKEDRQQGELIVGGGVGLSLAGMTSLAETAAVVQKSTLLVSGDSGVLHIAAGLGVPTVSLFGPGRVKKWAPRGEQHIVINKELPCSPCTVFGNTPPCPHNIRCMSDITVDEVVNAVTVLLSR